MVGNEKTGSKNIKGEELENSSFYNEEINANKENNIIKQSMSFEEANTELDNAFKKVRTMADKTAKKYKEQIELEKEAIDVMSYDVQNNKKSFEKANKNLEGKTLQEKRAIISDKVS